MWIDLPFDINIIIPPWTKCKGYIGTTLSVRLSVCCPSVCQSVCADSCPAHNFFFGLTLAYHIWHIGVSVAYIHDPDTTLNFDLKVKFIGFLTCFCVRPITIFWFDTGLPYLAYGVIAMKRCHTYIHVPYPMLTFDLQVKFIDFCHGFVFRPQVFSPLT